jgi:hypothetical protein
MKVSMENDINFGYEKITLLVDNMPLISRCLKDLIQTNKQVSDQYYLICK